MDNKKIRENIISEIEKLDKKKSRIYFFVFDTKGTPNASLSYMYDMAHKLIDFGYDAKMLYSGSEFVGVEGWLGTEYSEIPHFNVESESVTYSPSDIIIFPEIFSNVMYSTMGKIPCKRVAMLNNFGYLTEMIQPGASWESYGIHDCITISDEMAERGKELFPNINFYVIPPSVNTELFYNDGKMKKPFINIISKDQNDYNMIVKSFFLKYPSYKWIVFRSIKGISKEEYANALRDGFATIWIDTDTSFGISALEAMACGNLLIGKIPEEVPAWIKSGKNKLSDCGIWFDTNRNSVDMIADIVQTFLHDSIPTKYYDKAKEVVKKYSNQNSIAKIREVIIDNFIEKRKSEFKEALAILDSKNNEVENKENNG